MLYDVKLVGPSSPICLSEKDYEVTFQGESWPPAHGNVEVCIPVTVGVWGWPQHFTRGGQACPKRADGWLEQLLLCLTSHLDQPPSR